MTTSKTRIQNYLRQNKISELFEEMMGKLVRDLPASPIYYLVNFLQDKEKKVKQITRQESATKEKKLEVSNNAKLWATAPAPIKKPMSPTNSQENQQQSPDARKYDKPWLTHSKKSPSKSKSGERLGTPSDTLKSGKMDWSQKTKISGEKLDDVVDGDNDLDLGLVYAKPKIVGEAHVRVRSEEEEMAAEYALSNQHTDGVTSSTDSKSAKMSAKEAKKKRLEELQRLAASSKSESKPRTVSPMEAGDDSDDDALEVYEDANELRSEGVKNPPKSGVIVGRSSEKGKEEIELVLNMSKFFDELGGMEGIRQSSINGSDVHSKLADDDEDFESASQVTGPRRPVWEAPESEVESVASQLRSARLSGIGVESFVTRPTSGSKTKQEPPKPETPKRKNSTQRPKTAPSRPRSTLSNGPEPLLKGTKSPRSGPATPKGSVVGSNRASRRSSQVSNVSEAARKEKNRKTSEQNDDVPDTGAK